MFPIGWPSSISFLKLTSRSWNLFWGHTPSTGYGLRGVRHQCAADGTSSGRDRCLTLLDLTQKKAAHGFNSPVRCAACTSGSFTAKPLWRFSNLASSLLISLPAPSTCSGKVVVNMLLLISHPLRMRRSWLLSPRKPASQMMARRHLSGSLLMSSNKCYTAVHWPWQNYTKLPVVNLRTNPA